MLYATLWELPSMLPHPLAPEHLIPVIRDNDADIRAIAVSVDHFPLYMVNFNARILSHFTFIGKQICDASCPPFDFGTSCPVLAEAIFLRTAVAIINNWRLIHPKAIESGMHKTAGRRSDVFVDMDFPASPAMKLNLQ